MESLAWELPGAGKDYYIVGQEGCPACKRAARVNGKAEYVPAEELMDGSSGHPARGSLRAMLEFYGDGPLPLIVPKVAAL